MNCAGLCSFAMLTNFNRRKSFTIDLKISITYYAQELALAFYSELNTIKSFGAQWLLHCTNRSIMQLEFDCLFIRYFSSFILFFSLSKMEWLIRHFKTTEDNWSIEKGSQMNVNIRLHFPECQIR